MRTIIENTNGGEVVGRLFNRIVVLPPSRGGHFTDPYEVPWSTKAAASAVIVGVGGGFFSSNEKRHRRCSSTHNKTDVAHAKQLRRCDSVQDVNDDVPDDVPECNNNQIPDDLIQKYRFQEITKTEDEESWGWFYGEDYESTECESYSDSMRLYDDLRHRSRSDTSRPSIQSSLVGISKKNEIQSMKMPSAIFGGIRPRQSKRNKVEFVGCQTVCVKDDQTDTILCCDFLDAVEVMHIPHFSDYGKEVCERIWYTRADIEQMKQGFFYWRKIAKKEQKQRRMQQKRLGASMNAAEGPSSGLTRLLTTAGKSHNLRYLRHQRTIASVIKEQERQRKMCHKIYGRIVDHYGNRHSHFILDPVQLRDVYSRVGKTYQKREEALNRARMCRLWLSGVPNTHLETYTDYKSDAAIVTVVTDNESPSNTPEEEEEQQQQQQQQQSVEENSIEEWSAMDAYYSGFWMNISSTLDSCVGGVFYALLCPFLKQRREPIFLEVGEEMLVT